MTPITDEAGLQAITGCTSAEYSEEFEAVTFTFGTQTLYVVVEFEDSEPVLSFYTAQKVLQ
ncbi:MAG: hypothetical protein ACYCZJ_13145 [Sulfuriferula sp.]